MNVAVILTGQFREYKEVYDNFDKYVLQPLQPDVFIHTWDNLGINTGRYQYDTEEPLDIMDVLEKYLPTAFAVEDHKKIKVNEDGKYKATNHQVPVDNILHMFRKTQLGYGLLSKSDIEYDLVIKARPDIKFESKIPQSEVDLVLGGVENVFIPDQSNMQICDHLAFASSFSMGNYCGLYSRIPYYYRPELITPNYDPTGSPLHAESLLYKHLVHREEKAMMLWEPQLYTTQWSYHIPHKRRGM